MRPGRLALEALTLAAVPVGLSLVTYFGWGFGVQRFAVLVGVTALVAALARRRGRFASSLGGAGGRLLLVAIVAALGLGHLSLFAKRLVRGAPCTTDMAAPSVCAFQWAIHGHDPYATCLPDAVRAAAQREASTWGWCAGESDCVDRKHYRRWSHHGPGLDFMDGYKYGPLLPLIYAPASHPFGENGVRLVNYLAWLALLAVVATLARRAYPQTALAPWRALVVLMAPIALPLRQLLPTLEIDAFGRHYQSARVGFSLISEQLGRECANDAIPVGLALLALVVADRGRSATAGVLLAASLATKQLPGAFFVLLLPGLGGVRAGRFLLALLVTGALLYLGPLWHAPRELFANLVLYGIARPPNTTSLHRFVPAALRPALGLAQLSLVASVAYHFYRKSARDLAALLASASLITLVFVALNKVVHGNYLIWVAPLAALVVAGFIRDRSPDTHPLEEP